MTRRSVEEPEESTAVAAPSKPVGKVVFVNFVKRHAEKPEDVRSAFDGPQGTTAGTATLLVAEDGQIVAALGKYVDLKEGESIEVTAVRNIIADVLVPGEVDWE